jgi:hypothetical protein
MQNPNNFVSLSNGVSTCFALEAAGLAGVFDESMCNDEIIPSVAAAECCMASPTEAPVSAPPGTSLLDMETLPTMSNSTCEVCGPDATVANPNLLVNLDIGVTTCAAFANAALAGVFDDDFCVNEVPSIVSTQCGCTSTTAKRRRNLERHHYQIPREVDVGLDSNTISSSNTSSGGSTARTTHVARSILVVAASSFVMALLVFAL